jgi:AraC-like DNA-binding protein
MKRPAHHSPLPSSVSASMGVRIFSCGHYLERRVCQTLDRVREDYLLLTTLEGTAYVEEDGQRRELVPGDWFLLRPGLVHSYAQRTAWTLAWVHFLGPLIDALVGALGLLSRERLAFRQRTDRSRRLLIDLVHRKTAGTLADEVLLNARLLELLACVQQDYTLEAGRDDPMARVLSYIDDHLGGAIALDELARCAHLSTFHFARSFKRRFGYTPMRFVQKKRMELAQDMMRAEADLRVRDVARAVGFDDPLYFSSVFRAWTGASPREYMRAARALEPRMG